MKEFIGTRIESFRRILVRWHVAPLIVLAFLGYWTNEGMDTLASLPKETDPVTYASYAGVVTVLLGFMFAAFKLLLNGVKKDADENP